MSEDMRPCKDNGCVMRDHEYKRLGTLSLLAAIDLKTGKEKRPAFVGHSSLTLKALMRICTRLFTFFLRFFRKSFYNGFLFDDK